MQRYCCIVLSARCLVCIDKNAVDIINNIKYMNSISGRPAEVNRIFLTLQITVLSPARMFHTNFYHHKPLPYTVIICNDRKCTALHKTMPITALSCCTVQLFTGIDAIDGLLQKRISPH